MDREILVYADLQGAPVLAGRLWMRVHGGGESASFRYDEQWLAHEERFAFDPSLNPGPAPFHTEKAVFGAIGDSAPDRWGRTLMARAERRRAESERRKPRALFEADYLLGVNDESRQGALRFRLKQDGPFLAPDDAQRIPPLIELPRLLSAAERAANDEDSDEDLKLLLAPGSSLGGARPKASVRDRDGALALAKFPRPQDETNVVLWECTALSLAKKAGIDVPEWRIETPAGKAVLIMRRFDRDGARRIPFLSAMSMLGAADHETRSYLEIADALMQHGAAAKEDLVQLWRRIVFSVLVSNTDDHLRNHGFLYQGHQGWRLSPVYDLNPVPFEDLRPFLKTSIGLDDRTASIDLALETADYYGLKLKDAKSIAHDVARAAADWRREAEQLGAAPREIERMASAFEHEESRKALAFA